MPITRSKAREIERVEREEIERLIIEHEKVLHSTWTSQIPIDIFINVMSYIPDMYWTLIRGHICKDWMLLLQRYCKCYSIVDSTNTAYTPNMIELFDVMYQVPRVTIKNIRFVECTYTLLWFQKVTLSVISSDKETQLEILKGIYMTPYNQILHISTFYLQNIFALNVLINTCYWLCTSTTGDVPDDLPSSNDMDTLQSQLHTNEQYHNVYALIELVHSFIMHRLPYNNVIFTSESIMKYLKYACLKFVVDLAHTRDLPPLVDFFRRLCERPVTTLQKNACVAVLKTIGVSMIASHSTCSALAAHSSASLHYTHCTHLSINSFNATTLQDFFFLFLSFPTLEHLSLVHTNRVIMFASRPGHCYMLLHILTYLLSRHPYAWSMPFLKHLHIGTSDNASTLHPLGHEAQTYNVLHENYVDPYRTFMRRIEECISTEAQILGLLMFYIAMPSVETLIIETPLFNHFPINIRKRFPALKYLKIGSQREDNGWYDLNQFNNSLEQQQHRVQAFNQIDPSNQLNTDPDLDVCLNIRQNTHFGLPFPEKTSTLRCVWNATPPAFNLKEFAQTFYTTRVDINGRMEIVKQINFKHAFSNIQSLYLSNDASCIFKYNFIRELIWQCPRLVYFNCQQTDDKYGDFIDKRWSCKDMAIIPPATQRKVDIVLNEETMERFARLSNIIRLCSLCIFCCAKH